MNRENIIEDRVRLYSLVMYNISGIQAGIQSKHSGIELAMAHAGDDVEDTDFLEWAKCHKTVILKNGGTSNNGKESYYGYAPRKGSMEIHLETLLEMGIKAIPFYEPDLNYSMSSIDFIVDHRVYRKDRFPDYIASENQETERDILKTKNFNLFIDARADGDLSEGFLNWVRSIGGEKNLFLRLCVQPIPLANN
jgi:hypothetical protein